MITGSYLLLVPKARLELARPIGHHPLKMACLPTHQFHS